MKIKTKSQGSEFQKFDSVMKVLLAVSKSEIADKPKKKKKRSRSHKKH